MNYKNYDYITINSKKVKQNSIFVSTDSNPNHIKEAINNGASLIISKEKLDIKTDNIVVKNILYYYSYIYKKINNISLCDYKIIAVTGTDGKTTTTKIIYDVITERYDAIYIGTLGIISKGKTTKIENTTPSIEIIHEQLLEAKNKKIKYILLEASSEGLLSKRLTGIKFDVVIFTNLTREHLNTHNNMESYYKAKCITLKLLKKDGIIITNIDDKYFKKIATSKTINYGLHKGNIHTLSIRLFKDKTKLLIINNSHIFYYEIPLIGIYNVYNFLAAHACIYHLFNIKLFSFKTIKPIPGRFIVLEEKIIIDYAHTPNALENLLLFIKTLYNKKIILLIGSQGGKDKGKRVLLGKIADKYSDIIIVTSEDPKNEPVIEIISDISSGILNKPYYISLFRKGGIDMLFNLLSDEYIGVIVGKGNEDTQTINNIKYSYSDLTYAQKKLSEINHLIPNASLAKRSAKSL